MTNFEYAATIYAMSNKFIWILMIILVWSFFYEQFHLEIFVGVWLRDLFGGFRSGKGQLLPISKSFSFIYKILYSLI